MKKMKEINPKKWGVLAIVFFLIPVVSMAVLTWVIDPYFHYHAPLKGMSYRLYEQRYINDGISRHFEYDTVITGNSLSENIKTSQVDELFNCTSIKLPYSGAGYNELWTNLDRTLTYNPSVKQVFVIVDTEDMPKEKDYQRYSDQPDYLYDDKLWNDASYWWNKDVFYRGTFFNILMTLSGKESTTMDEYSNKDGEVGADVVLPLIGDIPDEEDAPSWSYGMKETEMVVSNINENIVRVVKDHLDVKFYLIYAPPSIARWGKYYIWGDQEIRIKSCKAATELLLEPDNIYLYSFQDDFDLVCDLDNYHDTIHYTEDVAEYMLEKVALDQNRVTKDNYEEYFERITDFYLQYDYQSLRISE